VVAFAAACSTPPPPPPPAPQRTTCGDVLSVALPPGFTCAPKPSPVLTAAFVEGPRVRIVLMAAPHLAPGDSSTDRPLRRGERLRVLSVNGRTAAWADRDARAALIQALVYSALGQSAAADDAFERARRLAGERVFADLPPRANRTAGP